MRVQVDTPNPAMDKDLLEEVNVNNMKSLAQQINKTGVQQALLIETYAGFAITGAALHIPQNFQGIITSSGGFFDIDFKTSYRMPAAGNLVAQLLVDDAIKDSIYCGLSNPQVVIWPIYLRFRGSLGIGRHKVTVLISLDTGSGVFSDSNSATRLQAIETLL